MEEQKEKPKVTKTQLYTIEVEYKDNGRWSIKRTNDGFHPLELLGILDIAQADVRAQIRGDMKEPEEVKRVVITD